MNFSIRETIFLQAKEEFTIPDNDCSYGLVCLYYATEGHYFEAIRLENKVPIRDQIVERFKSRKRSNTEFQGSISSSSSASKSSHHNVFMLCVSRRNDSPPRIDDERVMKSLVLQYSPSSLSVSSSQYSDLCALPELNEKTLLYHLKGRFESKKFYTYVGTILISVNPYWMDSTLFGADMMQKYQLQSSTTGTLSRCKFSPNSSITQVTYFLVGTFRRKCRL